MEYIYESAQRSYEDFASGRVLYNARGTTSFPVRLASEIVQRCLRMLEDRGNEGPYTLFDPCCGGGYLLTVAGLLHGQRFKQVIGSDVNAGVLELAGNNLSLLTPEGMQRREKQIKELIQLYDKPSHHEALQSVARLEQLLDRSAIEEVRCFQGDITNWQEPFDLPHKANLVLTDLPYGQIVSWNGDRADPVHDFFEHVYRLLEPGRAVVAVIADKSQKLRHDRFTKIQGFKVGKRQVAILEPKG
ncbi:hypothetical protein MKX64_14720 [Paenibacillus sp. FSL M8-0334]|uniref:rRNA methyltransferase n=1 Tax=Paenibacillus campinasensis TaxID=66347 RepID=A0ABW9T1F4_9BACL|nr:hypothetical protein [Paenibacillus campinasensis]MUG66523.1 hypothetical protein [Paenibacillus campinasensis]